MAASLQLINLLLNILLNVTYLHVWVSWQLLCRYLFFHPVALTWGPSKDLTFALQAHLILLCFALLRLTVVVLFIEQKHSLYCCGPELNSQYRPNWYCTDIIGGTERKVHSPTSTNNSRLWRVWGQNLGREESRCAVSGTKIQQVELGWGCTEGRKELELNQGNRPG